MRSQTLHEEVFSQKESLLLPMIRPRLELRTFCVLDRCDNQLRHRTMHYFHIKKAFPVKVSSHINTHTEKLYFLLACLATNEGKNQYKRCAHQ